MSAGSSLIHVDELRKSYPLGDVTVAQPCPVFAFVCQQEDLGMTAAGCCFPSSIHYTFQLSTLYGAQAYDVSLLH